MFGTGRQAITKHLKNIYLSGELSESSTCSILEHVAKNGKTYKLKVYSLDAVISVGYRVNSGQATQFRIWVTDVLKEHLIHGYTLYKPRLAQQGLNELQQAMALLQKTLTQHELVRDLGVEAIELILSYAKTWNLLLAFSLRKGLILFIHMCFHECKSSGLRGKLSMDDNEGTVFPLNVGYPQSSNPKFQEILWNQGNG